MRAYTSDNDLAKIYLEKIRQSKRKLIKEGIDPKNAKYQHAATGKFGGPVVRGTSPELTRANKPLGTSKSVVPYWKIYRVTRDAEPEAVLIPGTEEHGFTEQTAMAEITKRNKTDIDELSWWSCSPDPDYDPSIKEHSETDLSNPEEKKEVQIGEGILALSNNIRNIISKHKLGPDGMNIITNLNHIEILAENLVAMHMPK